MLFTRWLCLLSLLACRAPPVLAGPSEGVAWRKLKSAHFSVYTDVSPAGARATVRFLEDTFDAMAAVSPEILFADVRVPWLHWEVLLFREDTACAALAAQPGLMGFSGYMREHLFPAPMFCITAGADADELDTFRHELAHAFVSLQVPRAPRWFHEGMAEFLSTIRWSDERINVGRPPERIRRSFALAKLPTLAELTTHDAAFADRDLQKPYYDAAWLAVHALYFEAPYSARLPELFARMRAADDGFGAWRRSAPGLDTLMSEHFRRPMRSQMIPALRAGASRPVTESVVDADTYALLLSRVFLDRPEHAARGAALCASARAPATVDGVYWRALLEHQSGRSELAEALLSPIAGDEAADDRALSLLIDLQARRRDKGAVLATVARLRKLPPSPRSLAAIGHYDPHSSATIAEQCLALQPAYVPCHVLAVEKSLARGDREGALRFARSALAAMPHGTDVTEMRAQLDALLEHAAQ